jgi:hypothetical protein
MVQEPFDSAEHRAYKQPARISNRHAFVMLASISTNTLLTFRSAKIDERKFANQAADYRLRVAAALPSRSLRYGREQGRFRLQANGLSQISE